MSPSAAPSKKRKRDAGDTGKPRNEKRGRKTKLGVKPKGSRPVATDGAAASTEFISLEIPGEPSATPRAPLSKSEVRAVAKEKRRAPRNIRKEKRADKAAAAGAARKERERLEALAAENGEEIEGAAETEAQEGQAEDEEGASATPASKEPRAPKDARFIIFVGNLPYTATKESLASHFKSVAPDHIRLMTDKKTHKPKGYAFIEFDHYDRMKSCLKLYHHSSFDDGASEPRQINVELTVGGGGAGKERKKKILKKNSKLADERRRRLREEFKQKKEKEATTAGANAEQGDLHPSRRQLVKS